jgi:hypothetical protein
MSHGTDWHAENLKSGKLYDFWFMFDGRLIRERGKFSRIEIDRDCPNVLWLWFIPIGRATPEPYDIKEIKKVQRCVK